MQRRGFLGALMALVVAPFLPKPRPIGVSERFIAKGINHATFPFWRNQRLIGQSSQNYNDDVLCRAMRDIYNRCE